MKQSDLDSVLTLHAQWLSGDGGERANLEEANLEEAYLAGANLEGADLEGTCMDPAALMPKTDLSAFVRDASGDLVGWRTRTQPCMRGPEYVTGEYIASVFSVSVKTACHPGIYLCPTREEVERNYPGVEVIRVSARPGDVLRAGGKYRARRVVVAEVTV